MFVKFFTLILIVISSAFLFFKYINLNVLAENIQSGSFEIIDFNINRFGSNSVDSGTFTTLLTSDEILDSVRFSSGSYRIGLGVTNTWKASVPEIQCFETITSGTTNCLSTAVSGGMVQVCGEGGCFNRARFEIKPNGNPTDTLYSIQITTDPTWANYQIIDGSTFTPKNFSLRNINDYLTKTAWETPNTNIIGLRPGVTYYIRITALHGDFTETEPSPQATATTGLPFVHFDIDIANTGGFSAETSPPHSISLGSMNYISVSTSSNLIWIDFGTNATNGATVSISGVNGGLFSASKSSLIPSGNIDLSINSGFGVNLHSITQTYLGPFTVTSNYNNGSDIVGEIDTTPNVVFTSSNNRLFQGRSSLFVKAKPSVNNPASSDYAETIIFTILPSL